VTAALTSSITARSSWLDEWPQLDLSQLGPRVPRRHLDRFVQIGALDQAVPADLVLVSANGPSDSSTWSPRTFSVVASLAGRRPTLCFKTPRRRISSVQPSQDIASAAAATSGVSATSLHSMSMYFTRSIIVTTSGICGLGVVLRKLFRKGATIKPAALYRRREHRRSR